MVDRASPAGGLSLLQEEIDGGTVPTVGDPADRSSLAAGLADVQAAILVDDPSDEGVGIDLSTLAGGLLRLKQTIPSPDPGLILWSADFKNGVYTVGEDSVTLADMFGENLDWSDWSPDSVDPGVGMVLAGDGPVVLDAALALVLEGATYVIYVVTGTPDPGFGANPVQLFLTDLPGYVGAAAVYTAVGDAANAPGLYFNTDPVTPIATLNSSVLNLIACTLTPTAIAYCQNGGSVVSISGAALGVPNVVALYGDLCTIEKIEAYSPVADAELVALSTP